MSLPTTEKLHDMAGGLELRPLAEIAQILVDGQIAAAKAVLSATPAIADGARLMAEGLKAGGNLYYVGAGSSGLFAGADALELGGTFGIAPDRVRILMAGGMPVNSAMPGATEDDGDGLEAGFASLGARDVVIAVASSGTTPYTVTAAQLARERGAKVIGIANNPDTALLAFADIAILLPTPPELIAGSTRMGAGTAQKIALNAMSTLMGIELGHVFDGMMVNLHADNAKLRRRAATIVRRASGADEGVASDALAAAEGDVKLAVLVASGAGSASAARDLLEDNEGNLHQALDRLRGL